MAKIEKQKEQCEREYERKFEEKEKLIVQLNQKKEER